MSENPEQPRSERRRWVPLVVTAVATALVTAGVVALLVNIMEHKQEARSPYQQVVELKDDTQDPAIWGRNYPAQYDSYKRTVDQQRTRYGGSEAVPRTPTKADPRSMQLRVTRPAFMAGIKAAKAAQGIKDFDVNRDATRQEMRTFTCGQCHVEYFFKGKEKRLTYPWDKGLKVEQIYAVYAENGHKDWVHAKTGAKLLKAQHPEFEMYNQGIHARSGVTCADCHMPYKREGAQKVSDHHVRSPLLNINRACQTCHKWPEAELKARVETLQERTHLMRDHALNALMDLVKDVEKARAKGVTDAQLAKVHELQRRGQFYVDFVEAENSTGFHAPEEALRILGQAIDHLRQGLLELRKIARDI